LLIVPPPTASFGYAEFCWAFSSESEQASNQLSLYRNLIIIRICRYTAPPDLFPVIKSMMIKIILANIPFYLKICLIAPVFTAKFLIP
jgi:hypothetical protein